MFSSKAFFVWAALATVFAAGDATATPSFPDRIRDRLNLPTSPDCSLCHVGPQQRGTVTTPFGTAMRERGLQAYDDAALDLALAALAAEGRDSDADGTPDVRELESGSNPNLGARGEEVIVPEYGCSHGRMSRPAAGGLALALLGLAGARARAERNRRARLG